MSRPITQASTIKRNLKAFSHVAIILQSPTNDEIADILGMTKQEYFDDFIRGPTELRAEYILMEHGWDALVKAYTFALENYQDKWRKCDKDKS